MDRALKRHPLCCHLGLLPLKISNVNYSQKQHTGIKSTELWDLVELFLNFTKWIAVFAICLMSNTGQRMLLPILRETVEFSMDSIEHFFVFFFPQEVNYLFSVNCLLSQLYKQVAFIALQGDTARYLVQTMHYFTSCYLTKNNQIFLFWKSTVNSSKFFKQMNKGRIYPLISVSGTAYLW